MTTIPSVPPAPISQAVMRGASRSLAVFCLASFLTTLDRMAFPVLVEPMRREFHLTDTVVGLLTGLTFTAMYGLASVPVARWADVGNRRRIIALSLGIWSVMTAACGLAQSTWQLFAARLGGGVGEAGSTAPVQSLIADYYPPQRRALPLSLFTFTATLGGIVGYVLIGLMADRFGWRQALFALGLPGLLATFLISATVVEPRQGRGYQNDSQGRTNLSDAVRSLARKRCARHLILGFGIWGFAAYGIAPWLPTFYIRTHGLSLTQLGASLGMAFCGGAIGILLGGVFANRLLGKDLRWGLWQPVIAIALYVPLLVGCFLVDSTSLSFALFFVCSLVGGTVSSPLLTIMTGLVKPDVRAVTMALMGLLPVLIGSGLGPVGVGALSDYLQSRFAVESLRYSMVIAVLLMYWGAVHFYVASRHLLAEFEDPIFLARSSSSPTVAGETP
jgi:MFS family permease